MQSPYDATSSTYGTELRERKVFGYFMVAIVIMLCAMQAAFPGLVLLNQELDLVPTNRRIVNVQYDGKPVPLRAAMRDSFLFGSVVLLPGILLAALGLVNLRWNSRIARRSAKTSNNSANADDVARRASIPID